MANISLYFHPVNFFFLVNCSRFFSSECVYVHIYKNVRAHIEQCIYTYTYITLAIQFSHSVVSDSLWPPWTAAHQASLSITNSWSLLKLISIESVTPSNHLILCCPLLFFSVWSTYLSCFLKTVHYMIVSHLSCGTQDLHCGAQSLAVAHGSVVVVHGLSFFMTCGILVPQRKIVPMFSVLQGRFLTTGPPGKSLSCF